MLLKWTIYLDFAHIYLKLIYFLLIQIALKNGRYIFSVPTTCRIICDDIRIRDMHPRAGCFGCSIF